MTVVGLRVGIIAGDRHISKTLDMGLKLNSSRAAFWTINLRNMDLD